MALSFAFGGDTGTTYDDLKRRQAYAQAMWARGGQGSPKNAWEGLNSAAQSITGALLARKLGRELKGQQDEYGTMFNAALGGFGGQPASAPPRNPDQQIADDAMRSLGKTDQVSGGRDEFIAAMMPHAMRASEQTGLDPRLIIAQAAQETGWGKHAPGNNYFGIKSHGKAGGQNLATNEVVNGQTVRVNDSFRAYGGMGDSVDGYASFLKENPRYRAMLSAPDLDGQLAALGKSGYATDPNYAASVGNIARSIQVPQGQQGGVTNPMLLSMISDPRASDAQRGVLQMLLQQQLQNADPMRALQMKKLEAEVGQIGKPSPTDDMREYSAAVAQGYQGTLEDWMMGLRKAGATNITNNSAGERVKPLGTRGQILVEDPNAPGGYRVEIAPGSELDIEQKGAANASSVREGNRDTATTIVTNAAQRAREAASNRAFGGVAGAVAAYNPSSQNAEVYRQVDVLRSNASIENLQAMRAASPTGGALGSVTEKENAMLADKAGKLDPKSPYFLRDLDDYERTLLRIIHGPTEGDKIFDATRKEAAPKKKAAPITSDEYKNLSDEELMRRLREQ